MSAANSSGFWAVDVRRDLATGIQRDGGDGVAETTGAGRVNVEVRDRILKLAEQPPMVRRRLADGEERRVARRELRAAAALTA